MNSLKVVLVALLIPVAALAQQPPAFKPYAARHSSDTIYVGGSFHTFGGEFSQLVEGGITLFQARRHAEALEHFKRAVSTPLKAGENFNLRDAYYYLGVTYEVLGRKEEAIAAYKQVETVRPERVRAEHQDSATKIYALYNLANVYADSGRHREAVAAYKRLSEIAPEASPPYYNIGLSYAALGETQSAIEAFTRAVKLSPSDADTENKELTAKMHYNLGVAQGAAKRYGAAVEAFKEAITLAPEYAEAHYNSGVAYHLLGDRAGALKQLEILTKLKPQFAEELKGVIK